ncbi:MAG: DUF87 domain-containing protein [Bacilli bacterium]|nr:DUF87 domain-containing protein [Bacilli bacterium]
MAKRKRRKTKKTSFEHKNELIGILLVLIGILGIGKYGLVGRAVASFGVFLVGSIYMVLLVVFILLGLYIVINREMPDFFSTKLLGIYIFVIGVLVLMHKEFVAQNDGNAMLIFKETMNELTAAFHGIMNTGRIDDIFVVGGGIIGGVFALLFDKLFSFVGMEIVSFVLIGIGVLLFTGFSILDYLKERVDTSKEKIKTKKEELKEKKLKEKNLENTMAHVIISGNNEKEEIEEPKKVINSISELTTKNENIEEKQVAEEVKVQDMEEVKEQKQIKHNISYTLPPIDLLERPKKKNKTADQSIIEKNIITLEKVLSDFKINGKVVEVHIGPSVVQYELEIASGTRVNKITSINREIALALAKKDVRIEAPIPGKNTVGIEFANEAPTPVSFYEIINSKKMQEDKAKFLRVPLGKSIMGDVETCDVNKMPHLLIAGTTGSGKSVCVNGIICSILMRAKPDEVKLVMVDPKVVELSVYNGIPHLMCPVVSDPKKAAVALSKMVMEMERRYQTFSDSKTKNIEGYNDYVEKYNQSHPGDELEKMPYIVIIIDELADLMMVAAKEVEDSILRITQKARAAGMHLIVATQRPSTEVITGLIKANIPSRIAFSVGSGIDSRTILDQTGAENLLGKGDMLYLPIGINSPQRIQGSYITDDEIKRIIDFVTNQQEADYDDVMMNLEAPTEEKQEKTKSVEIEEDEDDPLYNEIVEFVISTQKASASLLQRKFKLGYNRAARIIDLLEERGIIGPQNGSKPREVLVTLNEQQSSSENIED